jgi:hypothetical protein
VRGIAEHCAAIQQDMSSANDVKFEVTQLHLASARKGRVAIVKASKQN